MRIKILTPATSANLGPGFDTLGLALNIFNELEIETDTSEFTIEIEGEGSSFLPRDKKSLVYQAIAKVYAAVGQEVPPLQVKQSNRIPIASGLGSSAAAIVGGLAAANRLLGSPLRMDDLLQLAAAIEGHPDNVAPALLGAVVASGMDEGRLIWYRIQPLNPPRIVVISPAFPLSTAKARQVLPDKVPLADAVHNISRTAFLIHCFASGDYRNLRFAMEDKLHQAYRAQLIPGLNDVISACCAAGGLGAALSGAGPAVIGFVDPTDPGRSEAVAASMQDAFAKHGIASTVISTDICTTGVVCL